MTAAIHLLRQRLHRWTFRFTRTGEQPVTLVYRSIYVLPTGNGLMFAFMLFVMWLGAVNYGNSMIFAFAFLLASVSIVAILHTFRNLRGIRVAPLPPEPVFAGDTATFPVQLENPGADPRTAVGLQLGREMQSLTDLPPHGRGRLELKIPAPRRGWLSAPRFRVFTIFPLGLFHAWSWLDLEQRCLIYPRPEPGAVPLPTGGRTEGGHRTGDGLEDFRELRRYQPGDSPRHVAWRVVARGQEPQTKQFGGEAASPVRLDWHALEGLNTEDRLSRLCRWVLDAEAAQRSYGLRLPSAEIPIGRGADHRNQCLRALALFRP